MSEKRDERPTQRHTVTSDVSGGGYSTVHGTVPE